MKTLPITNTANAWPLIRFIAPAYPAVNIFSNSRITPLGLVNVATAASTIWGVRVEIIDENNYRGPRDRNGLPDHAKLQAEDPAAVTAFYCGLTSTMDRVFELSEFYADQGCTNIAGGWHAHFCPEEVLNKGFAIVVHGDGEIAIRQILAALKDQGEIAQIPGISFRKENRLITNSPSMLELPDLGDLPYPDFGLIRYARKIKTYPIGRVRGCRMNCEFCSVRGEPRWANPEYFFNVIKWLVDTRGAKKFFIVDDRLEEDRAGLLELLKMIREKYGARLRFTVQIRLETARDTELLEAMRNAGVKTVCVGFESPIDQDLRAMGKGLLVKNMVAWAKTLRRYFWVHGMFIFGYPTKIENSLSVREIIAGFKRFIRRTGLSTIQVLHPVPLVGTELRARLARENRLLPPEVAPWSRYDGSFALFIPNNMSLEELQDTPLKLMRWFYSPWSFFRIPLRTILFPFHYLAMGWRDWHDGWLRDVVKYGGHRLLVRWQKRHRPGEFMDKLKAYARRVKNAKPSSKLNA